MSRSICLLLAASLSLAGYNLALGQDTPSKDDVASLQAENAELKKEVSDAKTTISQLQAQLAEVEKSHAAVTAPAPTPVPTPAVAEAASSNATPAGPLKALPLDATNAVANPAAPGADAGPARSYTVVKGDKLWTIAKKMYPGHTKEGVDKIQEANKDTLGTKPLKIGQVLIIPQ